MFAAAPAIESINRNHRVDSPGAARDPLAALDPIAVKMTCRAGQEIYEPGRPPKYWYRVVTGAVRRCSLQADGRRQILDLLLPGDFLGFASLDGLGFSIEAVADTTLVCYPRQHVETLLQSDPHIARKMASQALSRLERHLLILGRVTASEKVGAFLLSIAARSPANGDRIVLPVSRYDMADYLAISVETVSRALTELKHRGAIAFAGTATSRSSIAMQSKAG